MHPVFFLTGLFPRSSGDFTATSSRSGALSVLISAVLAETLFPAIPAHPLLRPDSDLTQTSLEDLMSMSHTSAAAISFAEGSHSQPRVVRTHHFICKRRVQHSQDVSVLKAFAWPLSSMSQICRCFIEATA